VQVAVETSDSQAAVAADAQAIFATSDEAALEMVEALRAKGGERIVVTYGGRQDAIEELKKPDSPLAMVVGVVPHRLGRAGSRQALNIVDNKQASEHMWAPVIPVTRDNYGSYPAWTEEPPRDLVIPWETDLTLEMKRE
jgi:ABC-type sugar transport system substrate-binding protein